MLSRFPKASARFACSPKRLPQWMPNNCGNWVSELRVRSEVTLARSLSSRMFHGAVSASAKIGAGIFSTLFLLMAACSFGPENLQTRHSTDLEARKIRRIAVIPPSSLSNEQKPKVPFTSTPAPENRVSEQEAPEILAKFVYSAMASMSGWQIVSDSEVRDVADAMGAMDEASRLR